MRIRVNPEDCQSVLDLCQKAGIPTSGMSFAQCVSMALASLLETARISKMLPKPDPFEFLNRMQPFTDTSHHRKKLEVARTITGMGATLHVPAVQQRAQPEAGAGTVAEAPVSAEQLRARSRLTELLQKKDIAEHNSDVIWSSGDEQEYKELYAEVYPHG